LLSFQLNFETEEVEEEVISVHGYTARGLA
jgi:hypothetical protein